ncbi:MAG: Ltp family lipoprotein [Gaiellaceae bacterium]
MTAAQEQAIQSAQSYLSMDSGFSRAGLIGQLSSSAGSGFPKTVAIFAVDHLHVNWNEQAVLSAKGYLSMGTGFSRAGLIDQLSSSAGSGFTHAQAVYAANYVGL